MELTPNAVSTLFQLAGTTACAAVLFVLASSVGYQYARKWAWMFALWCLALVSLSVSFQLGLFLGHGLAGYCLAEYAAGWLLLAGVRELAGHRPFRRRDAWFVVPLAVHGIAAPYYLLSLDALFPVHALAFGGLALAAGHQLHTVRRRAHEPRIGIELLRVACFLLGGLFLHYSLMHTIALFAGKSAWRGYLEWCSLYDALAGFILAFGMVVAAAENVRIELLRKNARLQAMARRLLDDARTDALTGLLNRRALEELIEDRDHPIRPGCVVVIDLDDLKPINDRFGHAAGDEAIEAVAEAMQEAFRDEDHLFRTGGDEFVVVVPTMTKELLQRRMAHFEARLAARSLAHASDQRAPRASWGLCEYAHHRDLELTIALADASMYQMKQIRKQGSGSYRRRDSRTEIATGPRGELQRTSPRKPREHAVSASDTFTRELASLVAEQRH